MDIGPCQAECPIPLSLAYRKGKQAQSSQSTAAGCPAVSSEVELVCVCLNPKLSQPLPWPSGPNTLKQPACGPPEKLPKVPPSRAQFLD